MSASPPPELSYAQPLFLEEQRASKVLGDFSFVMWAIAAAMTIAMLIALVLFVQRIPNALVGVLLGAWLLVVCAVILPTRMIGITVLEPAELQIRLVLLGFTVWKRTIP